MNNAEKLFNTLAEDKAARAAKNRVYAKITVRGKEDKLDRRAVLMFTCSVAVFILSVMFNPSVGKNFKGPGGVTQADFYMTIYQSRI